MTKYNEGGQDRTGQDRTGQDRTGQDKRTGQDTVEQDRIVDMIRQGKVKYFRQCDYNTVNRQKY